MVYTQVQNPRWVNAEHSAVECEVVFEHLGTAFYPFGANPDDQYPHVREIFARCAAGEFGPVAEFVAPPEPVQPISTGAQEL